MAKNRAESTWEINNYGKYINQFPPNIIKSIQQYERINKKICRQKLSIMFNEICINEEMLPKYTHAHTHVYIYIYIIYNMNVAKLCQSPIFLIYRTRFNFVWVIPTHQLRQKSVSCFRIGRPLSEQECSARALLSV